jgi:anti-anti-sigma factor
MSLAVEITKHRAGESTELKVTGRLDAYWSDHLSTELKSSIREGSHHLILNLSGVDYISSAGVRVLLTFYQQLSEIQGSLTLSNLSGPAKSVLEMAGVAQLLLERKPSSVASVATEPQSRNMESEHASFEMFALQAGASLDCKLLGDPELLSASDFGREQSEVLRITGSSFAFGVGAFGGNFEECKNRCGEFLAVAGAAAYLPTDGTNVPDYLISSGTYLPELVVLYGAVCTGPFSHLLRFEAKPQAGAVSLTEVLRTASAELHTLRFGAVLIAETAGLVGASLLKSPVKQAIAANPFHYPDTIDWLSFTAERAHSRSLALVVGMTGDSANAGALLRPMGSVGLSGHFHAAAFPYRPLRKGRLELESTVSTLFDIGAIDGLLHLLQDDRQIGGVGEREFIRGACWISPIHEERK